MWKSPGMRGHKPGNKPVNTQLLHSLSFFMHAHQSILLQVLVRMLKRTKEYRAFPLKTSKVKWFALTEARSPAV